MALDTNISLHGLLRLVIWIPDRGDRLDVDAGALGGDFELHTRELEGFEGGDGSQHHLMQHDRMGVTVHRSVFLSHLENMWGYHCAARAFAFSYRDHVSWQQPVTFRLAPLPSGRAAGRRLEMSSRVVSGHVYQGENVVGGYPWFGASATELTDHGASGKDYRLTPPGHTTDSSMGWFVERTTTEPSVSGIGVLSAGNADEVRLDWEFPCPSAQLTFTIENQTNVTSRTLQALDHSGGVIASVAEGATLTVPDATWKLRLSVMGSSPFSFGPVEVLILSAGEATGVSYGVQNDCGTTLATPPPWSS